MTHPAASTAPTPGGGYAEDLTLAAFVPLTAARLPDKIALVMGGDKRTFGRLDERAARLANALRVRGLDAGDRVGILMYNRLEFVEAVLATHRVGAIAVPLNFRLAPAELDYIAAHAGLAGLITDADLAEAAAGMLERGDGEGFGLAVGGGPAPLEDYEEVLTGSMRDVTPPRARPDDVALIMYTSGTTGRPKGAMLTHSNMVWQSCNMTVALDVTEQDVWLSGAPLFHIAGIAGILPFLQHGGTTVITPSGQFSAEESLAMLRDHGVTGCFFVPTQWDAICRLPGAGDLAPPLRTAIWGASPATRETLELMNDTLVGVDVITSFGQTEMCPSTTLLKDFNSLRKIGSIGTPMPNVEVRVVDDAGQEVPQGEVGEIVYRGPTVMLGYHDDEEATAEAFEDGWFHSGDLVRVDEDGFFYVVDRKKDMLISGGENVYPAEVEAVVLEHQAVADVSVIGVPHERWVETPLAIVVLAPGATVAEAELIEFCRGRIAGYKRPSGVRFVEELPRNAGGKVLKRELRDRFA
ncbi:MAG TPA: long-chain fatty acid--CoA ligase [Solirubrobacterales bacterium]|nr:long-chain fatty acid--CoA ligase [Solirubrobacterales bacterium]